MVWGVNSLRSADFTKRQRVRGFFFLGRDVADVLIVGQPN